MNHLSEKLTLAWISFFSFLYVFLVLIPKRVFTFDTDFFIVFLLIAAFLLVARILLRIKLAGAFALFLFLCVFLLLEKLLPLGWPVIGGIAAGTAVFLSSLGWGSVILTKIMPRWNSILEEFLFASALGLAVNSAVVLFLLRFFSASGGTLAVYVVLTLLVFFSEWTKLCKGIIQTRITLDSAIERLLFFAVMAALLIGVFVALSPPVMDDELMYHLSLPERWLGASAEAGRVLPDVLWSGYPMGMESLYTLALAMGSDLGARLFSFFLMILTTGGIAAAVRALRGSRTEALIAALLYCGSFTVLVYSSAAYSTSGLVFFTLMAGLSLILRERAGGTQRVFFSALAFFMISGAAAVKYTAWVFLPIFFALFLYDFFKTKDEAPRRVPLLLILLGLLILTPHVYKNVVDTGNPVFPYASSIFGGEGLNDWIVQNELANLGAASEETPFFKDPSLSNAIHHLFLPIRLTMADLTNRYQGQGTALGVGWLLLLPLFFFRRPWRIPNGGLFAFFCGGWILFFVLLLPHYGRFALPALVLTAVCYGGNLSQLKDRRLLGIVGAAIFFFALFPGITRTQAVLHDLRPVITGEENRDDYLGRRLGDSYRVWRWTAENTPENAAILSLHDYRRYYAERRWYCDYTSAVGSVIYTESDPKKIINTLFENKIYYLFLNKEAVDAFALPSPFLGPNVFEDHLILLRETPGAALYGIVP